MWHPNVSQVENVVLGVCTWIRWITVLFFERKVRLILLIAGLIKLTGLLLGPLQNVGPQLKHVNLHNVKASTNP